MVSLFISYSKDCTIVVILTLFESAIRVALPIVLIFLLKSLEETNSTMSFVWATIISVLSVTQTFAHHILFFFSMRLGWNWKTACTALIYDGLFHMSDSVLNNPTSGLGTGMLVNLISNDVSRLEEFAAV
jgi:ATP-binding cassette subfamily C (CFTR/MRP) protein 4